MVFAKGDDQTLTIGSRNHIAGTDDDLANTIRFLLHKPSIVLKQEERGLLLDEIRELRQIT